VTDEVRRRFILPLWNSYSFFVTYARIDGWDRPETPSPVGDRALLDRWIMSRANELVQTVRDGIEAHDIAAAARAIEHFVVEELSNWYIRRNRRRFWKPDSDADKSAAYETLYDALVLVSKLLAPMLPFLSEELYQNLVRSIDETAPISIHLTDFPVADDSLIDRQLSQDMSAVLAVVRLGRSARAEANIKVRQPLPAILVYTTDPAGAESVVRLKDQLLDELNVKDVRALADLGDVVSHEIQPNLPVLGPKYGKRLGAIRAALAQRNPSNVAGLAKSGASIELTLDDGSTVELLPLEVLVKLRKREGYAAAQCSEATVVLDTTLTPELIQEGLARDIVRGIQDARKQLELNIEDKIEVRYQSPDFVVVNAIEHHHDYIAREVLAQSLEADTFAPGSDGCLRLKIGPSELQVIIIPIT
jgi:isoleucyl-tRNA synthetase